MRDQSHPAVSAVIEVRQAREADFEAALALYRDLSGESPIAEEPRQWLDLLGHPGTKVFAAEVDGRAVALATLHVLPNMTFGGRPYALIENVVSAAAYRGRGCGKAVMEAAIDCAWQAGAYKIMLLTGQEYGARGFYERLGFTADEKFGMTLRRVPPRKPKDRL